MKEEKWVPKLGDKVFVKVDDIWYDDEPDGDTPDIFIAKVNNVYVTCSGVDSIEEIDENIGEFETYTDVKLYTEPKETIMSISELEKKYGIKNLKIKADE